MKLTLSIYRKQRFRCFIVSLKKRKNTYGFSIKRRILFRRFYWWPWYEISFFHGKNTLCYRSYPQKKIWHRLRTIDDTHIPGRLSMGVADTLTPARLRELVDRMYRD